MKKRISKFTILVVLLLGCCLLTFFACSSATGGYSYNDSSQTVEDEVQAKVVQLNESVKDNLSKKEEKDWFEFSIPNDGYITIDFSHEMLATDKNRWCMDLFMSDMVTGYGRTSGRTYWDIKGNENFSTGKFGVAAGTKYYIEVQVASDGWDGADYNITVNYTEATNWETESNHEYSVANELTVNETKFGTLAVKADHDWYKLLIPKDGYITIDFKHEMSATTKNRWCMDLFMSDSVTGYGRISGRAYWDIKGNEDFSTKKLGVAAGTYYMEVQVASDGWDGADYNITVNYTEATNWEKEVNNKYDKADLINVDEAKYGTLVHSSDHDWYKFVIPKDGYITVDFNHEILATTKNRWCMDLFMSDSVTGYGRISGRTYWDVPGNEDIMTNNLGVKAGTYYIEVQVASDGWDGADYSITVNYTEATNWETEVNNKHDKATTLNVNETKYGALVSSDDHDWYKLVIPNDGYITIEFSHQLTITSQNRWCMDLFLSDAVTGYGKANGRTYWDIKGNQSFSTERLMVMGGVVYYIEIQRASAGWHSCDYGITVHFEQM